MSSPFSKFATSSTLEIEGVWLNFGDFEIKCGRAGGANKRFTKVVEQYFEPHRQAANVGALSEETAAEGLANAYADAVIFGWRTKQPDGTYVDTIGGPDGEPMPFTKANVVKLLTLLPDFFATLRGHCTNFQNFRRALLEQDAKN